ncbi:hypothetical protein HDU93_003836, partial [Gonapodya sp. JEL0774]
AKNINDPHFSPSEQQNELLTWFQRFGDPMKEMVDFETVLRFRGALKTSDSFRRAGAILLEEHEKSFASDAMVYNGIGGYIANEAALNARFSGIDFLFNLSDPSDLEGLNAHLKQLKRHRKRK